MYRNISTESMGTAIRWKVAFIATRASIGALENANNRASAKGQRYAVASFQGVNNESMKIPRIM